MVKKAKVVNVFAKQYVEWSKRNTTTEEALDLMNTKGCSLLEALEVNVKIIEVISTHAEAASRMLRKSVDNCLESHIDMALNLSAEYRALRDLMPQDVPEALDLYQRTFTEPTWAAADEAIKAHGVEMAEGQCMFHGGLWPSDLATFTTSRPLSTSFCPQVALRNADWRGKAYDAGRVDLMLIRVTQPKTKAYVYSLEGPHGNEKEVVFASGAELTRIRETYITDTTVRKVAPNTAMLKKVVPTYVIEAEIS